MPPPRALAAALGARQRRRGGAPPPFPYAQKPGQVLTLTALKKLARDSECSRPSQGSHYPGSPLVGAAAGRARRVSASRVMRRRRVDMRRQRRRPQSAPYRKLCGSTSTVTRTPPRAGGAAASTARKNPCRSAERGAFTASRNRCRPRSIAIGASAGPSSEISSGSGRPPTGASRQPLPGGMAWAERASARACASAAPFPRPRRSPRRCGRTAAGRRGGAVRSRSRRSARRRPTAAPPSPGARPDRSAAARVPACRRARRVRSPAAAAERCARRRADRHWRGRRRHRRCRPG